VSVTEVAKNTNERLSSNARGHSPSGNDGNRGAATNDCNATGLRGVTMSRHNTLAQ